MSSNTHETFWNIAKTVTASVTLYSLYRLIHKKIHHPKGATASKGHLPIIGHLLRPLQDDCSHEEMLYDLLESPNQTCFFDVPGLPYVIFTGNPQNVEYILKTNFDNFPKGPFFRAIFEDLLGEGIFNADGHTWYHQRKTSSPMFSTNVLKSHFEVFKAKCIPLLNLIDTHKDSPIEFFSLFNRFTLECIGEIGFGVAINCISDSDHPFLRAFDSSQELIANRLLNPLWKLCRFFNTKHEATLRSHIKEINDFTYGLIKSKRQQVQEQIENGDFDHDKIIHTMRKIKSKASPSSKSSISSLSPVPVAAPVASVSTEDSSQRSNVTAPVSHPHRDFLSLFIAANPNLSDKELRDNIISLLIAGRDTTAQTLSWALYELLLHPSMAGEIRKELESLNGETKELLTFDQYKFNTPFLSAFIFEVLRLHPPVPRNIKQAVKECYFPDGTYVPAGSIVGYCAYGMGRHPELWGEDALEMKPERWMEMERVPSNYVYPTFQGGLRECLGKQMALIEIKLALSALVLNYDFEMVGDLTHHTYAKSVTLGMNLPLHVKCNQRAL